MVGKQILVCLLLFMLDGAKSLGLPQSRIYTDGIHKTMSLRQRYQELQEKQVAMGNDLSNVSSALSGVKETMVVMKKQKELETKALKKIKEEVKSLVSEQSRVTKQLAEMSEGVRKVEENTKDVKNLKTDVSDIKEVGKKAERRVTRVNNTLHSVQRSLYRIRVGAATCAEVKKCSADATDGEYWLYPTLLEDKRVKIFCSRLNTSEPEEFVSLPNPNKGEYPAVSNSGCTRETTSGHPKKHHIGQTTFNKIRVNITTMEIIRGERRYAESKGRPRSYGSAADCYSYADTKNSCGPKGSFNIDTRNTGLRVKTDLIWVKSGFKARAIYNRGEEGQIVNITCGGFCGGCYPKGGKIILEPSPNEVLEEAEATYVKCRLYNPDHSTPTQITAHRLKK